MMQANSDTGQRGIALLGVLWTMAIMALLVSGFNASVRSNVNVLTSELASIKSRIALEAVLELTVADLVQRSPRTTTPGQVRVSRVEYLGQNFQTKIQDTSGLVDLNKASDTQLLNLIENTIGSRIAATQLRDRILDWRDSDHSVRTLGAEDDDYLNVGSPHGAGDSRFVHTSQLRDVLGVDADVYRRLQPLITVFGGATGAKPQSVDKTSLGDPGRPSVFDNQATNIANSTTAPAASALRGPVGIRIVRLVDGQEFGPALDVTILLAPDQLVPYRVLAWEVVLS